MKATASLFLPFFILMTLAGCASQKVFLNDYKLNESSVKQVQELLESEGFDVQVIWIQPPRAIHSSTLLSGSRAAFYAVRRLGDIANLYRTIRPCRLQRRATQRKSRHAQSSRRFAHANR